jgi:hypothetical protein
MPVKDRFGGTGEITERQQFRNEVLALFPWLEGSGLLAIYLRNYVEHGDPDLAWAYTQQTQEYDDFFPGMKRDDGSTRMTEMQYMSRIEGYRRRVAAVGINPDVFASKYGDLIAYDKSPDEFGAQVSAIYDRIILGGQAYIDAYANAYGFPDTTREVLIASLMDDDIHNALLDQQITVAEITGEGVTAGFDPGDLAEQLEAIDFSRADARRFFGEAQNVIPAISILAQRHADPDDDFDLNEFAAAEAFNDPTQGRRIRRLFAQEKASFQQSGQLGIRTDQAGGLAGLEVR